MAKKKITNEQMQWTEAPATPQPITETLEKNYMPYAMSVIISRAIPEIDGFKPAHRKLLYTMYEMGLLNGARTKSANIVGQTMHLNPHGDASIYETMVRLTRGNAALLHPFIDSKGSFGKQYSRDMAYAASRYTEAKLDKFCQELFSGIEKDAVDFVPNYDNTTTEPVLLPTTFPNILVSPNIGIAVGMACSICSFNLAEICDGTVAVIKNPNTTTDRLLDIIKAPDFSGGGEILYDREALRKIYETGVGTLKMRAKYVYNKKENTIDILEIPYTSSIEAIMKKAADMIKGGKLREVSDVRDAIDLTGFRLTFDLRKDADPEIVMKKLFASTELENTFDCNFNILVEGTPKLLGIKGILCEWIAFRKKCLTRELNFDLKKKEDKLHLLLGLAAILLDIDKAIRIIRNTEHDSDVVPNLAVAFNISDKQAEYIAEIKLRNLNREYILNRIAEMDALTAEIEDIKATLKDELRLNALIISQLNDVKKKYAQPRKTALVGLEKIEEVDKEELFFEDYNCRLCLSRGGYFKKLSVQAQRAESHKLKDGDTLIYEEDTDNRGDILFFTDKGQIYRARVADFELTKMSQMGDYIPTKLSMDEDEHVIGAKVIYDIVPEHQVAYIFENGKGVRVPMSTYDAKTRRRRITGAFSTVSKPVGAVYLDGKPCDIFIRSSAGKGILIRSDLITEKATRTAGGSQLIDMKGKATVDFVTSRLDDLGGDIKKCRKTSVPSTGSAAPNFEFD